MMTSKVLRLLEKRGLLRRSAHESDARSVRIGLSPDGRALAERAATIAREFDDAFFGAGAELLGKELQAVAGGTAAATAPPRHRGRTEDSRAGTTA